MNLNCKECPAVHKDPITLTVNLKIDHPTMNLLSESPQLISNFLTLK